MHMPADAKQQGGDYHVDGGDAARQGGLRRRAVVTEDPQRLLKSRDGSN
jgi:hypothetical protein